MLIYFYILRSRCLSFSDSPQPFPRSPRVRLSLSFLGSLPSSVVGSTSSHAHAVRQLRGSRQKNEIRSAHSRRLLGDDGRCFDWAQSSALKPGVSGTWCIRWMQKPRLTIFMVAIIADSAARRQQPLGRRYQNFTICDLPFRVSSLQPFLRHHFLQSMPRLDGCQPTCYSV